MTIDNGGKARHLLKRMLLAYPRDGFSYHQWLLESDRWKELAFSLVSQTTTNLPGTQVRQCVDHLQSLGLLSVADLAALLHPDNDDRPINDNAHHILDVFEDAGFSADEARRALITLVEAAAAIVHGFSGKIQLYLRRYAQQMIDELRDNFHFTQIGEESVRYAFTFWLQNVLNMPLSLEDQEVKAFSKARGVSSNQLFLAADDMDVNVALVDDLVHHFHTHLTAGASKKTKKSPKPRRTKTKAVRGSKS